MNYSAPMNNDDDDGLTRIECVVREYPPQTTTLQLGEQITTLPVVTEENEMVAYSGEKKVISFSCVSNTYSRFIRSTLEHLKN